MHTCSKIGVTLDPDTFCYILLNMAYLVWNQFKLTLLLLQVTYTNTIRYRTASCANLAF